MQKKKVWNVLKTLLKILVTGGLLYYVFRKIDLQEVGAVYQHSNPMFVLLAIMTFFCSQVVSAARLQGFFQAKEILLPFLFNLKLYFLGMFYNLFLPGGIGGDGYKVYLLSTRFNHSGKKVISAIFLDRLSGFCALALVAAGLTYFVPELNISPYLAVVCCLAGIAGYLLVYGFLFAVKPAAAATGLIKALVVQLLQVFAVVLILFALNFEGSFAPYLFTFLASSLVAIFPFTIGGLGAREYVFVLASGVLAMDQNLAVSLSLAFYLISALVALSGVYFVFRSKELSPIPEKVGAEENEAKVAPVR